MNVLEVDSVFHSFVSRKIFSGIYFTCKTCEIVGIIGRNGCGKTTLLKIIFGTLKADNSTVRINNQYHKRLFTQNNYIAYLPEHNFIPGDLTVKKSISMFLENKAGREKILQDSRIKSLQQQKIRTLSGGERRYLEIVMMLHINSQFILLDEPFTGIEPIFQEHIKEMLREHKKEKGFVITDHDYHNILDVSDRLVLIKNGECIHVTNEEDLKMFHYLPSRSNQE